MIIKHAPPDWGIPLTHPFIKNYLITWIGLLLCGLVIFYIQRKKLQTQWSGYFEFLFMKWKLATFAVSGIFVSVAGYWTDDESWDVISGLGMSIFTFFIAPLAVGVCFRFIRGKEHVLKLFLAVVFSFFAFSWFYDGYLILRDGTYTHRWFGNLILSGIIYLSAGLFWNLEQNEKNSISLGFTRNDWPRPPANHRIGKAFIFFGIPLGLIALFFLVGFVGWTHPVLENAFDFFPKFNPYR